MEHYRYKLGVYMSTRSSKCSLVLNNVIKVHNKQTILNGVNLTAYSGKICAILGEINCGKSALLSCLVGGDTVDKGQIWVLGGQPRTKSSKALTKNIGYMPQDICLYNYMTIQELFMYFCNLYNINHGFTRWRITYYEYMFLLPQTNIAIENLSLSQKRMVSFLISVFHRPRLVVLDEPTVGLDFLKQHKIWKYLNHMCDSWKPTVIVATNSIEEAFLATKIAYMKKGKIIFEKKVEELQHMNPDKPIYFIIEDLCNNPTSDSNQNPSINLIQTAISRFKKLSLRERIMPRSNIWKLQTLIFYKLKFLTKNIWMFIIICMIPLLQVILHCIYYGKYPQALPVSIFNQETDCVKNPCESIEHCTHFSCHLLNELSTNNIKAKYYSSEHSAKDSVVKGLALGFMRVPEDYTNTVMEIMSENVTVEGPGALSKSGIYIEINMTTYKLQEYFKQQLFNAQNLHLVAIYRYYNLSINYANIPMKIYEYANLNLTENTASGIISCAIFSSAMFYSALSIQSEIQNGYLTRNIIAGVTIYEILLSFVIAHSILSVLQAFFFFLLAELLLNISWHSSLLLIVVLNIGIGFCGMNIGLLIGSFANSEVRAFHTVLIVHFVNIIIAGIFWPLDSTMSIVELLTLISPLSIPLQTVTAIMIGGRHHNEFSIRVVIYFIFWTIVSFAAFIIKFRNKINFIL